MPLSLPPLNYAPWPDRATAQRFVAGLAGPVPVEVAAEAVIEHAAAITDWLHQHGLAPLAYQWCRTRPPWQSLTRLLTPAHYDNQTATLLRHNSLHQILTHLSAQSIPAVLLKGGALSLIVYSDPALRPMGDVDFWIDRAQLPQAWQVAEASGYAVKALWRGPESLPDRLTQVDFYTTAPELCLEWHWDLVSRPQLIGQLPLSTWRTRLRSFPWQGATIYLLDPAAMLLHLALHQMYQHWGDIRLIWLYDLDRLIRGTPDYHLTEADWVLVRAEAHQAGVLPGVQVALRAAAYWFNTPLPPPAQSLLAEKPPADQQHRFDTLVITGASSAVKSWHELREQPGWSDRLTIMATKLFPPPAYMRQRYHIRHHWLVPFYYPWRWLKMVRIIVTGRRE
ncbi:MAG: nucleotidyltransferase family protein [Chloroflexi bacterium]|nr:nucleotidyltransferase family protein [Chloroflexota bacterium]MBP8054557.1 nucleotidyltransferase family protein [Chloroflexota bacterium]